MLFHEKLDFIMSLTKTTNSALSMHISLDASHISRLRRGERRLVRDADYIKKMSAYFARQCVQDHQKKALLEAMNKPSDLCNDIEETTELIYLWFLDTSASKVNYVKGFLKGLTQSEAEKGHNILEGMAYSDSSKIKSGVYLYYGFKGKRDAVIRFLSMVLESPKPCELLLYSDESMEWLIEDVVFMAKWADLLCRVIEKGNRIKIIHTVSRNLNEMLEALSKWVPLYMTGAIEPFYYPKKRDGIFKRTLFIAPNEAAITSSSIDSMADRAVNILLQDKNSVIALTEEFNEYMNLCKPLMRIFTDNDRLKYLNTLDEFEKESGNAIAKTGNLSIVTMPDSIAKSIIERSDAIEKKKLMEYVLERKKRFLNNLRTNHFCEIIQLPNVSSVKKSLLEVNYFGLTGFSDVRYQAEEYRKHIINVIELLQTYENYDVAISRTKAMDEYKLYVKEDLGAIVIKTNEPHIIFAINESNMTAAFWDYLNIMFSENKLGKNKTIKLLQGVVDELTKANEERTEAE